MPFYFLMEILSGSSDPPFYALPFPEFKLEVSGLREGANIMVLNLVCAQRTDREEHLLYVLNRFCQAICTVPITVLLAP